MITQIGFDPWHYDADGDCYISADEAMVAVHDWQYGGKITMSDAMAVVNLWQNSTKNPACGVPPVFDPWAYDKDGDCYISATEKDQAIADWQSGKITVSDAMAVVNLWVMGTKNPACGVPPEIAAHIDFGVVWFYINSEEHIVDDRYFPADLPLGTPIHCSVSFCNDSNVDVILRTKMEIIDPDGLVRASDEPGFLTSAGWCDERYIPRDGTITLDKKGIWKLHAEIEEPFDEKTWNAITVSEQPPIPPGNATLFGLVTDVKANPIVGASITLVNLGEATATTGNEGKFEFRNIATGEYTLTCKKQGYKTDERDIFLESGGKNVTIILEKGGFPWQWLAIGGAAIAGVILLIPRPKKAKEKVE